MAQLHGFEAAQISSPDEAINVAAPDYLQTQGYDHDYQVSSLAHVTSHGVGLDIHQWPYLVRGDKTLLAAGMCFSNEPCYVFMVSLVCA
jgi:Xaa-Pro dipeptidase